MERFRLGRIARTVVPVPSGRRDLFPMTKPQFQAFVLGVLKDAFPDRAFEAGEVDDLIICGDEQFGLSNLYAKCGDGRADDSEFREFIAEHFGKMIKLVEQHTQNDSPAWSVVKDRLRPQFMPARFAEQAPLVHLPVGQPASDADVLIGIVLDSEAGYSYVRQEDAALWGRTADELFDAAVQNLNDASRQLPMALFPEPNLAIVIETKDGYDAARLLLPGIRRFAAEKLGEPFYAGIPNRDFLIMWSQNADAEFQHFCRERIGQDFDEQDHPLSPRILVATAEAVTVEE